MNYHEAAIFLEEGENNDKFNSHPKNQDALPAYLIVHNHWFYSLDFLASLLLLALATIEEPTITAFKVPVGVHGSLELLALFVVGIELAMKFRWLGWKTFFQHKRTFVKASTLLIMFIEAIIVLIRQTNHFRVTRAFRPIFLIDNRYCGGVRRFIRQTLQSLPPIIDMLALLMFFVLIFAIVGFYLFSPNKHDPYFSSFHRSFINLFVLLTTANFPDVMMPAYSHSRWAAVFFILYLSIVLYFLMSLMLAVVYETFTVIEKEKFRKLLLHKRKACQHAFKLLVSRQTPNRISFRHYEGLMKFFMPKKSRRDIYLSFKSLNICKSGYLSLDEFYQIYIAAAYSWKSKKLDTHWFHHTCEPFRTLLLAIHKLVTWKWFENFMYVVIFLNGVWVVIETVQISNGRYFVAGWSDIMFLSIYSLEAVLKLLGLGLDKYFSSGWNIYDFVVTSLAIVGLIAEICEKPFYYIMIFRPLRLLTLFKMKRRYHDIFGTLFILLPRMVSASIVLIILYYFFSIVGMELFAGENMKNCCKNTTVEDFYRYENETSNRNGYYYDNNFNNIFVSGVTLFELTVVNNWFIIMEGYASVTSEWSRIYFMTFYVVTMVVMTIVVAFILEAFLFRIQYQQVRDNDENHYLMKELMLQREELNFCFSSAHSLDELHHYTDDTETPETIIFIGTQRKTKNVLSLKMYEEEVKQWLLKAEQEECQHEHSRLMHGIMWNADEASINATYTRQSIST